jgi:hypothetical protein
MAEVEFYAVMKPIQEKFGFEPVVFNFMDSLADLHNISKEHLRVGYMALFYKPNYKPTTEELVIFYAKYKELSVKKATQASGFSVGTHTNYIRDFFKDHKQDSMRGKLIGHVRNELINFTKAYKSLSTHVIN